MTNLDGVVESSEALTNPTISPSPDDGLTKEPLITGQGFVGRTFRGQALQGPVSADLEVFSTTSSAKPKKFFCLPAFAGSSTARNNVCATASFDSISSIPNPAALPSDPVAGRERASPKRGKKRGRGKPSPSYRGINYGSISEAALGILLEQLIPNFSVKEGHTFQLPLGQGRTVDFLIENTLVEFHFPRSYSRGRDLGDFKDKKERRDFLRSLNRVGRNRHQRKKLLRATHKKLLQNYVQKRRKQIDLSLYGPHTELIVASTPEEFYHNVICRFVGWDVVSEEDFVRRFEQCCRSVVTSSRQAWKEAA